MVGTIFATILLASGLIGYSVYKSDSAGVVIGTISYFTLITLGEIAFLERYCNYNVKQKIELNNIKIDTSS